MQHKCLRQLISHDMVSLDSVMSENNIADMLTKGLVCQQIFDTSRGTALKPIK